MNVSEIKNVVLQDQSILQDYIPGKITASYMSTFRVRSAARNLICERRTKTPGARAFGVVAPKVWHDLLILYDLATLLPH